MQINIKYVNKSRHKEMAIFIFNFLLLLEIFFIIICILLHIFFFSCFYFITFYPFKENNNGLLKSQSFI